MRFLLDTNAIIAVLNEPAGLVSQHLRRHLPADIGLMSLRSGQK